MLGPPLDPFGLITIACPTQPPCGRLRPLATPCGHLMDAKGTLWRLRALPSARSEVASTTATKAVETPVTARRNHADRVQGSIQLLSEPANPVFKLTFRPVRVDRGSCAGTRGYAYRLRRKTSVVSESTRSR